jgi:hypothetical protein
MADTPEVDEVPSAPARSRRRALLALWGTLAVAALAIGVLAVQAGDDDPPRLPIALGAGGGDGRAMAESDAPAGDAAMSMMAWVRYVAGDDLPALGGDGPAYRLSNDVDPDRLQEVAAALGLDGELREEPESPGTWTITGADGSTLSAGPYGGGGWWYTDGALMSRGGGSSGSTGSSAGCAADDTVCEDTLAREREAAEEEKVAEAGTTDVVDPCPPDTDCGTTPVPAPEPFVPPADLPSEDEAEQIALDLFRGMGVDVEDAAVTVEGPSEAWYVSIEPRIDGMVVSGYVFNAAVGSDGEITTAGGVLNRPVGLGSYPTVDTRTAIDRLNEQSVGGFGDGREPAIALDGTTSDVDCASATAAAEAGDDPAVDPAVDPGFAPYPGAPCEPGPPAEPTEVVLHEAERILLLVPGFDEGQDSYLVPGYRFRSDEIGWVDVISVDDDSLLPPPVTTATEPVPLPEPDPGTVEPGGTPGCAPVDPGPDGAVPDICLDPDTPVEPPVGEG